MAGLGVLHAILGQAFFRWDSLSFSIPERDALVMGVLSGAPMGPGYI